MNFLVPMENSRLLKQTAFSLLILLMLSFQSLLRAQEEAYEEIRMGVILDMGSWEGKFVYGCINMAISDFYAVNPHYKTRILLHTRDTKGQPLLASYAALDLLENAKVQAIIGPDSRVEASFLEALGEKANVPILSFSTSPFSNLNPNLLQIVQDETTQFKGITAMVQLFKLKNVILICEDTRNGREMATYMVSEFQGKNIHIKYTSLISISATNEQTREELYRLQNMQTTTFVMHTGPSLASIIFSQAKEAGMMGEGYVWIVTSKTTNFLNFVDEEAIKSMQGVVGFKSYFPKSRELHNFVSKWRKEYYDLNTVKNLEVDCNGIWAYDAVYALAMAVEKAHTTFTGPSLLNQFSRITFHGLGGEFKLMNGRTVSKAIEVLNVIGKGDRRVGFWMDSGEFIKEIGQTNLSSNSGLEDIIFPGGTKSILKRRKLEMKGKKLKIIVPLVGIFPNLIQMTVDSRTNLPTVSGFCGDVFNIAFNALNYGADIEFTPYPYEDGRTYNDLIEKVYFKEFDAAVGDITITSNRSHYVDFTLTFTDMGVGTLARNTRKSMWIFLDPLSADLWLTSASFFLFLGFVIWFIEHRTNKEFQGSTRQQIGTTLWFSFSTLVYAHRENLQSNLSKFIVTIWVFVVLVLTSSYTATLSSVLTVQQIAAKGGSLQHQGISPVVKGGIFKNLPSTEGIMGPITSIADYANALRSGKVGAITDEILYIKSVLALYSPAEFSLIGTAPTTNGFAFVFQKDSSLAKEMSAEIAKLREEGTLKALEDKWLKHQSSSVVSKDFSASPPNILDLYGLRGLFLTSGLSMAFALLVSMVYLVREKLCGKSITEVLRHILRRSPEIHPHEHDLEPTP